MMMYDSIFYLLFASKIFFSLSLKVFKLIDVKSFTLNVQLLVGFSFCRVERSKSSSWELATNETV